MPKNGKPKWTIMVYLAGDNNLTTSCISVLQQLESVKYDGDEICVLACFDSNTPAPKGAQYFKINCTRNKNSDSGFDWEIHNDLVLPSGKEYKVAPTDFHDLDPGFNPRTNAAVRLSVAEGLKRFINWGVKQHSDSTRYMLILYGHGPVVAGQTFLAKENPPSSLRLEDIRGVLEPHFGEKRKIDIVACQNCVMNGIETAYELKEHVDFMIGSQGLVLANGWPYEKMISEVVKDPSAPPRDIAKKLLTACSRHMLDFVVMERSSEQSLSDLTYLRESNEMTDAIRELGSVLREGLQARVDDKKLNLIFTYPPICNAIRIARLEAQSYWGETFVDLYDFCERLLKSCDEVSVLNDGILNEMHVDESTLEKRFDDFCERLLKRSEVAAVKDAIQGERDLYKKSWGTNIRNFEDTPTGKMMHKIMDCCIKVQDRIKTMIPESFYVGPELQYSHGLSIYFPWTLPGAPFFFTRRGEGDDDFTLKTAFEAYCGYRFVDATEWASFLKEFFRATLRNVRRADREFNLRGISSPLGLDSTISPPNDVVAINLQKSSSDTGIVNLEVWSNVKNYPRRNYLSPVDYERKTEEARVEGEFPKETGPPVSYLGWNITGLVADAIRRKPAEVVGENMPASATIEKRHDSVKQAKAAPASSP